MSKFVVPRFVNPINVGDASGTKRKYYIYVYQNYIGGMSCPLCTAGP